MNDINKALNVNELLIVEQWDRIAELRDSQLRAKIDTSFDLLLKPYIINVIMNLNSNSCLDFGCGTGVLTEQLSIYCKSTTGIDISKKSIEIASRNNNFNIIYLNKNLTPELFSNSFDLVVANMTLQDVVDLEKTINHIYKSCCLNSKFIFTITHPWFWPMYWNYQDNDWFNYNEEIAIEAPFKISKAQETKIKTVHFHRPIHHYTNFLTKAGFIIEQLNELKVHHEEKYPRFLAFQCKKN